MTSADWIVERLQSLGVNRVFGVPGGACSALDNAIFKNDGIEFVICQHEATAGYMAMGYALQTKLPGVVIVTSGPGVLNVLTPLSSARLDEVGLIVLAGDVISENAGRGCLQDGGWSGLSIESCGNNLASLSLRAEFAYQIPAMFDRCIQCATGDVKSSAILQLPMNLQAQDNASAGFNSNLPAIRPTGNGPITQCIQTAAKLIVNAKRPLLMFGIGAKRQLSQARAIELATHLHCPVITDAEGVGMLPTKHPLLVGCFGVGDTGTTAEFVRNYNADLLVVVGCRFDDTTTGGYSEDLEKPDLLQIDYNEQRLGRAFPICHAVHGVIENTVQQLLSTLPPASDGTAEQSLMAVRKLREATTTPIATNLKLPLDPRTFFTRLSEVFETASSQERVVCCDIGNHLIAALGYLSIDSPNQFHFSMGLGGMGSGFGMGLGMAAAGNENVITVCGDGGVLMAGNEIYTCVKYKIGVVLLVMNDGVLGMVNHGMSQVYGKNHAYELTGFSVVDWASSLGASAMQFSGADDFTTILNWNGPGPLVVDVPIDSSVKYSNPRIKLAAFPAKEEDSVSA